MYDSINDFLNQAKRRNIATIQSHCEIGMVAFVNKLGKADEGRKRNVQPAEHQNIRYTQQNYMAYSKYWKTNACTCSQTNLKGEATLKSCC